MYCGHICTAKVRASLHAFSSWSERFRQRTYSLYFCLKIWHNSKSHNDKISNFTYEYHTAYLPAVMNLIGGWKMFSVPRSWEELIFLSRRWKENLLSIQIKSCFVTESSLFFQCSKFINIKSSVILHSLNVSSWVWHVWFGSLQRFYCKVNWNRNFVLLTRRLGQPFQNSGTNRWIGPVNEVFSPKLQLS